MQISIYKSTMCASVAVLSVAAFGQASLVGIGDLAGGERVSTGRAVSADGSTLVGDSSSWVAYWGEPTMWTAETGLTGLGLLEDDHDQGTSTAVSPAGRWVVGDSRRATEHEAFLWSAQTGMVGLGDLPGGRSNSYAAGVSAGGRVVVGTGSVWRNGDRNEAFRWTPDGGMRSLGALGGEGISRATGVSADGSVIVGGTSTDRGGEAFRWTESGGMVALGVLDDRRPQSFAWAVSPDGDWVAGVSTRVRTDGGFEDHAVRWGPDGQIEWLGFPGGEPGPYSMYSRARAISDDGRVIVGAAASDHPDWQGHHAFIWTEDWGMRRLVDVLADYGVDHRAEGWNGLEFADGISADGTTIVGTGARNGSEGFVVTLPIPAPGSASLLVLAGVWSCRRRR